MVPASRPSQEDGPGNSGWAGAQPGWTSLSSYQLQQFYTCIPWAESFKEGLVQAEQVLGHVAAPSSVMVTWLCVTAVTHTLGEEAHFGFPAPCQRWQEDEAQPLRALQAKTTLNSFFPPINFHSWRESPESLLIFSNTQRATIQPNACVISSKNKTNEGQN